MYDSTRLLSFLSVLLACATTQAQPLGTSFTYQGELQNAGAPAEGPHDLRFRLFDAAAGGAQVGPTLCADNVPLAQGRFTLALDFGAVFSGQQRFLEVEVRPDTGLGCGNPAGFVLLAPRQALTVSPHAAFSLTAAAATTAATATNATQLNGQGPSYYLNAGNLASGTLPDGRLGGVYSSPLTFSNAGNAFTGAHSGPGSGLTGLNASNLSSGTLVDGRLSGNVALLNAAQTVTGPKTFSAAPSFTSAGAPFSVSSPSVVGNLNADLLDGVDSSAFLQAVPNPLTLSGTSPTSHIISGTNDATSGPATGVWGRSVSTSGRGVLGTATATSGVTYGGRFENSSTSGFGVFARASATSGDTFGIWGQSDSTSGIGIFGEATATSGMTTGVYGRSDGTAGRAVVGYAGATTGDTRGVYGISESTSGRGVFGFATAGSGSTYGGYFESASLQGHGVYGLASAPGGSGFGVYGQASGAGLGAGVRGSATGGTGGWFTTSGLGYAVRAEATATDGFPYAVHATTASTGGTGVFGQATAGTGSTYGGRFVNQSSAGTAVAGRAEASSGDTTGAWGMAWSTSGTGVRGSALATSGSTFGGYFESNSTSGYGVYGRNGATSGTIYGVRGYASTAAGGYAVYAAGDMGASGVKPFRIDHPQDPENKYLLHYSTESPEVLNAYSGTATLDGRGEVLVELPPYFASINKGPRYTLTAVGAPMPMLHVAEKIGEDALAAGEKAGPGEAVPACSFRIAGGAPGGEVCWRVEAVRNDLRMRLHGAPVEPEKTGPERGKYQQPECYGKPPEMGMDPPRPPSTPDHPQLHSPTPGR